jgi:hypothetical protein
LIVFEMWLWYWLWLLWTSLIIFSNLHSLLFTVWTLVGRVDVCCVVVFEEPLVSSAWTFQAWVSLYYWVLLEFGSFHFFFVMVDRGLNIGRYLICFIGLIWEFRFCGYGFIMVIEEENRRKKGCLSVYEYIGTFEWGLWHCIQAAS